MPTVNTMLDNINVSSLEENAKKFEEVILAQQNQYDSDSQVKTLLDSIFLEKDRERAFARFLNTKEFSTIKKLLLLFNVNIDKTICEIGGGPGFLTWALQKSAYKNVDLFEPNTFFNTGTGYLRTCKDVAPKIYDNLGEWHKSATVYDAIITKNCIHHFQNISMVAASIRQKMQNNGLWFAFREWFADTPKELYSLLSDHPYCQPYGLYEWPYPASHYVEAIEIAGFELLAVVPADYANNCLATFSEEKCPPALQVFTGEIDKALQKQPKQTVDNFWKEVIDNKFNAGKHRLYTRPQLLLFRKIDLG